jgi:hypothetical protein
MSNLQAGPDRYNKKIQDDPAQLISRCREYARNLLWLIIFLLISLLRRFPI